MQLGELQSQISRFEARGARVVALSVDPAKDSRSMIRRLGLTFDVVSDADQRVMDAYRVRNPDTGELALHAVYIVDKDLDIFYRKVASRRPLAQELLDAIDYFEGTWPLDDTRLARGEIPVAFPRNYFQALIEISTNAELPGNVSAEALQPTMAHIRAGESDDAVVAFRTYMRSVEGLTEGDAERTAAWLAKTLTIRSPAALDAGRDLNSQLMALRSGDKDDAELEAIRSQLDATRTLIRSNAGEWQLNRARVVLRTYRELALAAAGG